MPRAVLHRLFSLAYFIVLARCCGRRLPSPASPVGWSVVPALPPFSLSAAIAPVSHCSRLPLLVSAGVPAPAPLLNTLSHPIHSPTGGRVPRAPPCIWTASGLRAPPPCCRSAASPVVATHTRSHAHSHTRAPRRQDRRPHTTLSSRVAGEPLRRSSCIVLRTAGALLGPLRPTLFRCLPLPSHPVHPSRPSCSAAGGGVARGATSSACGRPWACAPFPCAAVPSVACRRWAAAPSCPRSTTHSGRRLVRVGVSAVCSHCFFPRPFLPWALSPGGHPRRVHGPCLVSFRVVVGVVRLCCSCVFSRRAMLVVPPVSSRRPRHALPPVPVSCCPTVPWCRAAPAVAAARRCRPWPQRPPAKFRRGVYRGSRAPWLCALAAGLIDSWSRPVMEFL